LADVVLKRRCKLLSFFTVIPDNLGADGEAVGDRIDSRTLQTGCVELFTVTVVLSEPELFNSNTLLMLWRLLKGCMGHAVVWIAELVRVKKS